jgi:hypothetical protein
MTSKRGHYGNGTIAPSGKGSWRIRYRIEGERYAKTVKGTRTEAAKELRRLLHAGGEGRHVAPDELYPALKALEERIAPLDQRIARKALAFLEHDIEPACYLYRHYHPSGDLLYVGISLQRLTRQERHAKKAGWRNLICRILIEPFRTREEALAAEEETIRNEFPKFNGAHNGQRHPIQELEQHP